MGVGWERRLSSAFPPAPPRLHPRPGTTLAPRPVASSPVSLFRPTSLPRSFEVGSEGPGRGRGCSARPHPTPRSFARGAGHDCLPPGRGPHGADPPVASRGLCGLTGGGSPPRGPLACPSPPAAGPGLVCLGRSSVVRCSGPAARSPGASPRPPSLGACSQPPFPTRPAAVLSGSLALSLLSCPLPAWRHAAFRSLVPLPWVVGGEGGLGRGQGTPVVAGRGRGVGGAAVRVELFFFFLNYLIKNIYTVYLFSSKTPHLLHRVPMERPPLSRTATDSTMKGQQGALLPSFLPGWPPGFQIPTRWWGRGLPRFGWTWG